MKTKRRKNRGSGGLGKWLGGIGCLALLAGLAVGGVFVYRLVMRSFSGGGYVEPPMSTEDVVVKRGDVTEAASLWGQVQAIRTQSLAFHTAGGRITAVEAMPGMPVTQGQVLVRLDVPALERTLTEARAALATAQADLGKLTEQDPMRQYELEVELTSARAALTRARQDLADYDAGRGTPAEERKQAAAALTEARAALNALLNSEEYDEQLAHLQYVYNVSEVEHGVYTLIQNPSEQDRDKEWLLRIDMLNNEQALKAFRQAHDVSVRAARQEVVEAERKLAELDREISLGSADVARGKLAVAVGAAEVQLMQVEADLAALGAEVDPVALAKAQAKVLKLEGQVADAEAALADAELTAPFDGTVLDVKAVPQGMASSGQEMVVLADTSAYVVVANLNELDVARVSEGMEVTMTFDAFGPDAKVTGHLGEIPAYGRFENGVSVFPVSIAIDAVEMQVMEGMGASITVPLGVRANVLTIPASAVDYWVDATYVNVVTGDTVERREVVLGVGDGVTVEVLEGLEEGEVVRVRLIPNRIYG